MRFWNMLLDKAQRVISPWLSLFVLICGVFVSYDFTSTANKYPTWRGLFDFLGGGWVLAFFLIAAFVQAFIMFALSKREPTIAEYREKIAGYEGQLAEVSNNIKNVFDGLLFNLAKKITVNTAEKFRLSIYVHDACNEVFVPCGRYSSDPVFARPGRTFYPEGEGCIAKGWQNSWHFDNNFPSTNGKRRSYELANYGLSDWVATGMRMQSNVYAALRIDNPMGQSLAVLVIEAIESKHFDEDVLKAELEGAKEDFARMVSVFKEHIPNPLRAQESGL